MTDPIADMLTRIRNANAVNKTEVDMPYSKAKAAIADVLWHNGYIDSYQVHSEAKPQLHILLNQSGARSPITGLERVSKPGRRVYVTARDVPRVLRGYGMAVISTSSGIMSGKQARKNGVGGELMCKIW